MADVVAREFVVIAGHIDHARALARLAQQLLHDVIMGLRPIPAALQAPAVDDVADEINRVGFVMAQEIQQKVRLHAARAKMQIGEEESAIFGGRGVIHCEIRVHAGAFRAGDPSR